MGKIEITDEWLYKYMPLADMAIIDKIESEVDYNYKFSRRFNRKMRKLIRYEKYKWLEPLENCMKKVAVFLFVILIALSTLTLSVEAFREKIFETIRTFYEDSTLHTYISTNKPEDIEDIGYTEPSYVPEGYEEAERIQGNLSLIIVYQNEDGEEIVWEQQLLESEDGVVIDSEYDAKESRVINGSEAVVYSYAEGCSMAYYKSNQYLYLITADNISTDELFGILESAWE